MDGTSAVSCNPEFTLGWEACRADLSKKVTECLKIKEAASTSLAKNKELDSLKAKYQQCSADARSIRNSCMEKGNNGIKKCKAEKDNAIQDFGDAAAERKEAQKKVDEGVRKESEAEQKQSIADANGQTSIEAIRMKDEAVRMKGLGEQQRRLANDKMIRSDQLAEQNAEMASTLSNIVAEMKSQTDQLEELADNGERQIAEIQKANGGSERPDGGASLSPAKKSGDQAGSPGGTKGEGSNGSPSQQSNNQQKKQDEAGGGGGGMPSMGGGSGSGSSSPLTVNEAKQDCSNPSFAASNPVCTCRLNATDSRCAGILAAEKNSQTAKKAANMYSDDSTGGGGGFSTAGGGYKTPEEKNISQHGQLAQGAGGSVGKGVGSGVGSKEANDPRQAQARSYRDQYTTGKRGGGSYGSGGGGSFAAGQAGQPNSKIPSTFARANVGKNQPQGKLSAADLRAQMQARFAAQRRGPSSTTGRADITGPHTDQFKKIRVRYAELMGL